MSEERNNKIQEIINDNPSINLSWLNRFFNMLEKCQVDERYIDAAITLAQSKNFNYSSLGLNDRDIYDVRNGDKVANELYLYLEEIAKKKGPEGIKEFFEKAIYNMVKDFEIYQQGNHRARTNFLSLFLRQLVKEFPQDVKLEINGESIEKLSPLSLEGKIEVSLRGIIKLGQLHFSEENSNIKLLYFNEFRTLPGLEGLKLGSLMFGEFCSEIEQYKPGYSLIAVNVRNGGDGYKTYSAWGAYPVSVDASDAGWVIDDNPLSQEEIDNWQGGLVFYFSPEKIQEQAIKHKERQQTNKNEIITKK